MGPDHGPAHQLARQLGAHGQAEVDELHPPARVDQQVVGLDVAVHEPSLVDRAQAVADTCIGRDDRSPRGPGRALPLAQRRTFDVLHLDHRALARGVDLVDLQDVVVTDASERLGLSDRPGDEQPRVAVGRLEQLERDLATELDVAREVHVTHRTAAEPALDHPLAKPSRWGLLARELLTDLGQVQLLVEIDGDLPRPGGGEAVVGLGSGTGHAPRVARAWTSIVTDLATTAMC